MPSNFDKYMSGHGAVSTVLQRNVREYYNDLKMLRADSQVRVWVGVGCPARALGVWSCSPSQATLLAPRIVLQIYYPVPNEVYRDEWDDVQVVEPMEFTHCRYTPVVTEVRGCHERQSEQGTMPPGCSFTCTHLPPLPTAGCA